MTVTKYPHEYFCDNCQGWVPAHKESGLMICSLCNEVPTPAQTVENNESAYGAFKENARITRSLMKVLQSGTNFNQLSDVHLEAFHMIFFKMSRVVNGDVNHIDNIHDIGGYSKLLEDYLKEGGS